MKFLNLGILAHVDAGKTSLTERLLFNTGVIHKLGSVDDGTTQTDSLALEQQRGITIKAAVASFAIEDVTINLIDTPGHPDFIAEVERALSVLDGAVLVISAVEGVQAQTRVLMRALQRLRIPTLIFINKIDRRGAQAEELLQRIAVKLTPAIAPMGTVSGLGTRAADYVPFVPADAEFASRLVNLLTERNDEFLAEYIQDEATLSPQRLCQELVHQTRRVLVHPVFFGSAITGAGVEALMAGIKMLLPEAVNNAASPVAGSVFKIERGSAGEKIAYVRVRSGTVHVRDRLQYGRAGEGRVTALQVFDRGPAVRATSVTAGQIGKLWGLGDIQIGDTIGMARTHTENRFFAPPALETTILPRRPIERSALYTALTGLTEQDPLINLRLGEGGQTLYLSLYGEVQKEVIRETLWRDYGLEVEFLETTPICIERPIGMGEAFEIIFQVPNPFAATVGLRVQPAPINSGVHYQLAVELGSLPLSFHTAVEETVRETLRQGLYGWEVNDCLVTMTHSGFSSPVSTAGDFRHLTPLVVMEALRAAGTQVHEPMYRFHLEIPAEAYGQMLPVLARLRATPQAPETRSLVCILEGEIPAAQVHALQLLLPGLSRGRACWNMSLPTISPCAVCRSLAHALTTTRSIARNIFCMWYAACS